MMVFDMIAVEKHRRDKSASPGFGAEGDGPVVSKTGIYADKGGGR